MKIGQVSKIIDLSTYTIRYYEKIGLLEKPQKNQSGHRIYSQKDVELINWVTCLKKSGMSLEKIKQYSQAYTHEKKHKLEKLLEMHLEKLKSQQVDLKHYIDVTEVKLKKLKNS